MGMKKSESESVNGCHFERRGEYASGLPRHVVVNTRSPEAETERKAIRARWRKAIDEQMAFRPQDEALEHPPERPCCYTAYRHPLKHEVVAELDAIRQRIVSGARV